jgi:signal transduction histidine kinase
MRGAMAKQTNNSEPVREITPQHSVLIVTDDAEFSRNVVARWQMERHVPAFTLMSSELLNGSFAGRFGLAIVGPVGGGRLQNVLATATSADAPVILLATDALSANRAAESDPKLLIVRQNDGWVDGLVILATEALRYHEAQQRASRAESANAESQREATLGRYMIEMRHSCNNALTSILGNSELLLMEPGAFSADVREQIETIHSMSLRLHEILHRFSSIESEMQMADKESRSKGKAKRAAAFVSGV